MLTDTLLSRWQLREATGLPDATLDYWSRNGVLRTAQGGGGKGQHRRFASGEVVLAGILGELMKFGVPLSSMVSLAERFHRSVDWVDQHGIGGSMRLIPEMMEYWEEYSNNGRVEVFDDPVTYDPEAIRMDRKARLLSSWDEVVAYQQARYENLSDQAVRVAKEVAKSEFSPHAQRYLALQPTPRRWKSIHELILFKREDGEWDERLLDPEGQTSKRTADNLQALEQFVSYFRIDLSALRLRLWGPKVSS